MSLVLKLSDPQLCSCWTISSTWILTRTSSRGRSATSAVMLAARAGRWISWIRGYRTPLTILTQIPGTYKMTIVNSVNNARENPCIVQGRDESGFTLLFLWSAMALSGFVSGTFGADCVALGSGENGGQCTGVIIHIV